MGERREEEKEGRRWNRKVQGECQVLGKQIGAGLIPSVILLGSEADVSLHALVRGQKTVKMEEGITELRARSQMTRITKPHPTLMCLYDNIVDSR